ncbi:HET domain-containing protein [Fusarium keratoplasticum]|uniref:HET domain-containing protein n=1 Tax=Fusarium keratoplasticum TaxID=1328300 RepID=A0ACC0QVN7_9HYPO|nr:HET domain-containing protein [Fusarium keratoplasticum]KAI8666687.1 HET domain-containing protein [Fusarium keratoplasticum]
MSSESIYTPLSDPDTIRVLEIGLLHPGSHQLSGRLTTESLHDQPDYVALSYVWGVPSPTDPLIDIDGHPFQVRESLFQAIKVLVSDTKIRVWVDQISINQIDNTEKEHQIQLMSKIYSQARLVVGWLGAEADNSSLAMKSFRALARKVAVKNLGWNEFSALRLLFRMANPRARLGQACISLVQRPWFHRLWIVQEVALAKHLELRCGTSLISTKDFFMVIQILSCAVGEPLLASIRHAYEPVYKLGQLRAQVSSKLCESFPHVLQRFCTWDCGMPQDRLNGLLGVAFHHDPAAAWFKPTYSMSAPDLFTQFAMEHIQTTRGLEILHFAGCEDSIISSKLVKSKLKLVSTTIPVDDVASWVPDWRLRGRPLPLLTNSQNEICVNFSATASAPDFLLDSVSRTLNVRAIEVGRVKATSPPYHPSLGDSPGVVDNLILDWLEIAESYIDSAVARRMFPQTLTMDLKVGLPRRIQEHFDPIVALADFERHNKGDYGIIPGNEDENWKETIDGVTEFRYTAEELCRHRLLFITEGGRLGLGGPQVEEGDTIYLIHGLKTPFVVNSSSQGHLLRGECYLHGLMDGKVQRSDQDTTLHLR